MIEKNKPGPIYQWYTRNQNYRGFVFLIIGLLLLLPLVFFTKKVSMVFTGIIILIICFFWLFVLEEQLRYKVAYWKASSVYSNYRSLSKIKHLKTYWFFILIQVASLIFGVILSLWLILH